MSRKLEDLFNLPHTETESEKIEDNIDKLKKMSQENKLVISNNISSMTDRIDIALPTVKELDESDKELDELAQFSFETAKNLIDTGLSVDPRFGGKLLEVASSMMTNSINAKVAKMDKKLKMVELQLRKMSLDQKIEAMNRKDADKEPQQSEDGQGIVMDRNALLKEILSQSANAGKKP